MKDKAETMRFKVIKERYFVAAEIWDELARKAEERSKNLNLDEGSAGIVDLLREEVTFLEDFLKTLEALPRASGDESSRYHEVLEMFRKHGEQSDELHRQLKLFRDKLKADPQASAASK